MHHFAIQITAKG